MTKARLMRVISPSASMVAISLALSLSPSMANAQTAEESAGDSAGEIIVTAQRREQRLQDVPIAITAVGNEQLAQRGVTDISGLVGASPGVSIANYAGISATAIASIRGVSGQVLPIGSGQAVAFYLDGVFLPRPDGAFFSLDDVERLEVLRGPQGTLYGRNATGGAINIITRDPGNTVRGGINLSYGNYNTVAARASLSGPLGGGFSAGVSASLDRHDGFITNTVTGNKMNARKAFTIRGKLKYATEDNGFSAVLSGDYAENNATPVFKNPFAFPAATYVGIGNPNEYSSDSVSESLNRADSTSKGVALTLNLQAADKLKLTSITSYRDTFTDTGYDVDSSSAAVSRAIGVNSSKSFSQELRGVYDSDALTLTFGANYFHEKATFGVGTGAPSAAIRALGPFSTSNLNAFAVFGQLEYHLTEQLSLVGGLRYNHEKRDFTVDYTQPVLVGGATGLLVPGSVSDNVVIPSFGLNFQATPDVLLYAKAGKGYQAPGFNFSPGIAVTVPNTFAAEKLWAYEIGAKTQFLDRRVTLNLAAFRYDYSNLQIRSVIGIGLTRIDNAAGARNQGAEASLEVRLPGGISFGGQVTYLDSKFLNFCQAISAGDPLAADAPCTAITPTGTLPGAVRDGNRLNLAPKWSGGLHAGYEGQIGGGTLSANVTLDFSTKTYSLSNANEDIFSSGNWGELGARLGYTFGNGPEIYIYGKNLTDKRYISFGTRVNAVIGFQAFNNPRTYGAGVRYKF
ncbi:MAG: TonB-dependent receptor [Novosphingobium sp.]